MKISGLFIYITIILMVFGITATASSSMTGGLIVDWFAGDGANLTNVPNATVAANKITWDKAMQWDGGSTNLVAATGRTSLGLGTLATQNSNSVSITGGTITGITNFNATGGTIGGTTNFNIINPAYFTYRTGANTVHYTYVNDSDTTQNDVYSVIAHNNNPEGSDHYTTAYRFEMFAHGGNSVDGVQGLAGVTWTDGAARAKSIHGSAADTGSTGSDAIAGVIGQVSPGSNTNNAAGFQSTCSGDYGSNTIATAKCIGIQYGSSGNGIYQFGILSQVKYSTAFMNIENGADSTADFIRYKNASSNPVFVVDSRGYIAIGTNTTYQINYTEFGNRAVGAIDIHSSVTDLPIANDWISRSSGSKQKIVTAKIAKNDKSYSNKSKNWNTSKWFRQAIVTDGEVISALGKKQEVVSPSNAFDITPDAVWRDMSKYDIVYFYNATTGNITGIKSKTPITNYSVTYTYDQNGTIEEVRKPEFQLIPTGKMVKTLKSGITFNELDGKFYKEVQHDPAVIEAKRQELLIEKQKKAQFSKERVGGLIDDPNVPIEILEYNEDGSIKGYGLELMSLYLFEVTREQSERIDDLENKYENLNKSIKP